MQFLYINNDWKNFKDLAKIILVSLNKKLHVEIKSAVWFFSVVTNSNT